jgi:pimeloyl-ACP methyl ester carboxylesterase
MDLSLAAGLPIVSLGGMPYSYLALKLRLEIAGFTVRWADYDWRRSIEDNGAQLAARITAEPARRQYLLGHSLGGLVARAALSASDASVERLVTLGSPHAGSFAALQALRASYITVRRIAQLDPSRSAEQLAEAVFASFPSLYQMLPARCGTLDLRDIRHWPDAMPRPQTDLVSRAGLPALPWNDGRSHCIAGTGFDTVSSVTVDSGQFRYHITRDGDGTVPRESAAPAGQPVRYTSTLHGELPRDAAVAQAAIELLESGHTQVLHDAPPPLAAAERSITDQALQSVCRSKLDWATLSPAERRDWFASLNQPVAAGSPLEPSA